MQIIFFGRYEFRYVLKPNISYQLSINNTAKK